MDADPRAELECWQAARATNFYDATPGLARSLRVRLGDDGLHAIEPGLRAFGEAVAMVVEPAVQAAELRPPSLAPADPLGRESQRVEFDPEHARAGRAVCASGIAAAPPYEQAALLYLLAHAGEGGHACPVVCTAGLIQALRRHGSPELQERFLPPLLEPDYDRCHRGAQFLTEVQGGSDVGANRAEAVPEGDDWRISGEKWFCSVADADQFLVTARVRGASAGTRGIGSFLVPRLLADGTANGFRIRRLKDKLGTRALATGEIEFNGALGHAIGAPEDGFHIAADVVLNTSRWLNALGSTGLMRRAYLEAASFSRLRTAFGRPIADYPLVRENLAVMRVEGQAALASTLELTALVDAIDAGTADSEDRAWHRILVNANKFVTSLAATRCVRRGIEALGGNGTIEDFSPLPRLYRDAIVFESWEGTHNVLCEQVPRDLVRSRFSWESIDEPPSRRLAQRDRPCVEASHFDGHRRASTCYRYRDHFRSLEYGDIDAAEELHGFGARANRGGTSEFPLVRFHHLNHFVFDALGQERAKFGAAGACERGEVALDHGADLCAFRRTGPAPRRKEQYQPRGHSHPSSPHHT